MKITIKTTQQKVFAIDIDPALTVAHLKQAIHDAHQHPVSSQKIIYSGQILTDDKRIDDCGIKEKDFLVLMVSKPKAAPPQPKPPQPAAPEPVVDAQSSAPAPAPVPEPAPAPASAPSTSPAPFGDPSSFLSGDGLQAAINNMVEMGFPKEQVILAMRASFNNPDRAVEYLMTGIPTHLEAEASSSAPPPAAAPPSAAAAAAATAPAPAAAPAATAPQSNQPQNLFQLAQQQQQQQHPAAGPGQPAAPGQGLQLNLEALRNNPQIQQLREQIAQNPALIQPLLQQIASSNPALAQLFASEPEAMLQLLGLGVADDDEDGPVPPGAHVVNVTEEERAAIQRLEDLGFPRQAVLEAYFACDKNEELAANYLFESNFDN